MIRYFTVCSFGLVVWIIDEVVALILMSFVTSIFEQLKIEKNEFNLLRRAKNFFRRMAICAWHWRAVEIPEEECIVSLNLS